MSCVFWEIWRLKWLVLDSVGMLGASRQELGGRNDQAKLECSSLKSWFVMQKL